MKAKVLYLLPSLMTGGLERMVHLLATNIDRAEFVPEVQIFDRTGTYVEMMESAGIPVAFDKRGPGFLDRKFLMKLVANLKASKPDLIHAHNVTSLVYATFAARLAGNIPVVYTEHDRAFPGKAHDRALHLTAGRMAAKIVVVADWIKASLVKYERLNPSRIEVVPNGIEGNRFRFEGDREAVRRSLGIKPGAPVAGCVARLVEVKNHRALLIAWRRVVDVWPDAILVLVGEGPLQLELEVLAMKLGISQSVLFLGNRGDVPALFSAMDFNVLSSHSEGMSLTLIEAMAAGKASVATAVGGNPEVIDHGRTGLLVAPGDVHGLAAAMATFVQDPSKAHAMGSTAMKVFEQQFTLEVMVGSYERIYREALAERGHVTRPHSSVSGAAASNLGA